MPPRYRGKSLTIRAVLVYRTYSLRLYKKEMFCLVVLICGRVLYRAGVQQHKANANCVLKLVTKLVDGISREVVVYALYFIALCYFIHDVRLELNALYRLIIRIKTSYGIRLGN